MPYSTSLRTFLHLIQLVAQLSELHVDLAELQVGVLLGGDSHLRQAPVLLACRQLGSCLPAERKLPSPLEDRVREQATDDQDDDNESDGDRATHDSTSDSRSLLTVRVVAAAMISLGVS